MAEAVEVVDSEAGVGAGSVVAAQPSTRTRAPLWPAAARRLASMTKCFVCKCPGFLILHYLLCVNKSYIYETDCCCQLPLIREVARQKGAEVPWNFVNGRQCNHRQHVLDQLCDRNSAAESATQFGKLRKNAFFLQKEPATIFSLLTHTHHAHAQKTHLNAHLCRRQYRLQT